MMNQDELEQYIAGLKQYNDELCRYEWYLILRRPKELHCIDHQPTRLERLWAWLRGRQLVYCNKPDPDLLQILRAAAEKGQWIVQRPKPDGSTPPMAG